MYSPDHSIATHLVIIDSQVDYYQHLVDGVIERAKVFVLDSTKDGK